MTTGNDRIFVCEDIYYGIFNSNEVDRRHAWSILLDEDSDIVFGDEKDPDTGSDHLETITFAHFTKGQGLYVFPFLAF